MDKQCLKRSKTLINIYEAIMGPVHDSQAKLQRKITKMKKSREKSRFSFGKENADKVFYVIKSDSSNCGIFSLMLIDVLPGLIIADKKNWIPVVDYKNTVYMHMLQDKCEYQKYNPWEYYFEQPNEGHTLEEVYKSANVEILNRYKNGFKDINWNKYIYMTKEELNHFNYCITKYIKPSKEVLNKIESEKKALFPQDMKVMAVSIRAGYRSIAMSNNPIIKGHPIIESNQYYIKRIEELLKEWNYDRFFLACDDYECVAELVDYFGNRCCHINRRYKHYFRDNIPVDGEKIAEEVRHISINEMTVEYIAETYLLSMCESAYLTLGGGAQFAYLLNAGKYRNIEIFDGGLY